MRRGIPGDGGLIVVHDRRRGRDQPFAVGAESPSGQRFVRVAIEDGRQRNHVHTMKVATHRAATAAAHRAACIGAVEPSTPPTRISRQSTTVTSPPREGTLADLARREPIRIPQVSGTDGTPVATSDLTLAREEPIRLV
ncbi:hypothetical protein EP51_41875 (plasmid) [Rhodococcus opacus]|uniref:Uncharacterized protein n=1 Tax=Rhodococcus opacus TaxID=37919 RepID=A0A076EY67_RHOOP|nr:hypothetical protein EP51_41875 [Rhodococcus opacus]